MSGRFIGLNLHMERMVHSPISRNRVDVGQDGTSGIPNPVKQGVLGPAFSIVYPIHSQLRFVDEQGVVSDNRAWQLFKFLLRIDDVNFPTDIKSHYK